MPDSASLHRSRSEVETPGSSPTERRLPVVGLRPGRSPVLRHTVALGRSAPERTGGTALDLAPIGARSSDRSQRVQDGALHLALVVAVGHLGAAGGADVEAVDHL